MDEHGVKAARAAALLALTLSTGFTCGSASARGKEHRHLQPVHTDVRHDADDVRDRIERLLAGPVQQRRLAAGRALAARTPGVRIGYDHFLGTPRFINRRGASLTLPAPGKSPRTVVRAFVDANADLFGHTSAALDDDAIRRDAVTERTGLVTLWWRQEIDGVPVMGAELRATVAADGRLVTIGSTMLDVDRIRVAPAAAGGPENAIRSAIEATGLLGPVASGTVKRTRPVHFPLTAVDVRPAVTVRIESDDALHLYDVTVDAVSNVVLHLEDLARSSHGAANAYLVYADPTTEVPLDSPAPMSPGTDEPDGTQAPEVAQTLIVPTINPDASPIGWVHDADPLTTVGNNTDVFLDRDLDLLPDTRTEADANGDFIYSTDLTQDPAAYSDAVVVQAFYLTNWLHDRAYELGLTEEFGAFQEDNFGLGGVGGDSMTVTVQFGAGLGAFDQGRCFCSPVDGEESRLFALVFSGPDPDRDGSLDAELMAHEYAHGITHRLSGQSLGSQQPGGIGEGLPDYYAMSMLAEASDDPTGNWAMGAYITYHFIILPSFEDNYYSGVRRYPYTTDMTKSPLTYADIDPAQFDADPAIPAGLFGGTDPSEIHNMGEILVNALWHVRAAMIDRVGPAGNQVLLQLVSDALKILPLNPDFLQFRDALLITDRETNQCANRRDIWDGFAARGMGFSAESPSSPFPDDVSEAFDVPSAGDVDGDGDTDFVDLLLVLSAWNEGPGSPADLDCDGIVGFTDLLIVLASWTG